MIKNIKSKTDLSGFYILFNGTVINEKPGIFGISHIIEHLLGRNMMPLLDDLERNGIEWNAYTSSEHINFFMTGLDEYVDAYKNQFLDKFLTLDITEKLFEKEKNVIIQEYLDHFNSQSNRHFFNMYRKYLDYHHVIGKYEDIKNLTRDVCIQHYEQYYKNPSKIFNVSKYNKFNRDMDFNKNNKKHTFKRGLYDNRVELSTSDGRNTSLIYLSDVITKDFAIINFINLMLSKGLNSPFLMEIRNNKSSVYYFRCELDKLSSDCGVITMSTETTNDNIPIIKKNVEKILQNRDTYLTEERFNIMKKFCEIHYRKIDINKHINMGTYLSDEKWKIKSILDTVTMDDIIRVFDKYYNIDNFITSVDDEEFV